MKKFFLALIALFAVSFAASAQKTELQIGYGGYTQMDATDMHDGGHDPKTAWGALTAGFNFKVAPNFWFGPSYTFSSSSWKHSDANIYYHCIMLNARYNYWHNRIVTLYGHVGLGVDISHITWADDSENCTYVAFQASPLGASVGLSRVATMFGEVGFGAQGLLQVGFRFNL